ncbi:MAG: hypothetical protein CYPHOPRED_000367, partial [Cyphobasidiales sp. Tagirdzhanova-0007]
MCLTVLLQLIVATLGRPMQSTAAQRAIIKRGPDEEAAEALRKVAATLLQQACELLEQISRMSDSEGERILTYESEYIPGSTIGKHLRHSLDHFRLLLDAVPASSNAAAPLQVNYDTRTRLLDMERKPAIALQSFQIMSERLSRVMERTHLDKSVQLSALTPHYQQFESSFGRELWFVALHSIHHFSLLKVIACAELKMQLPEKFGVAPSTLALRDLAKEADSDSIPPDKLRQVLKLGPDSAVIKEVWPYLLMPRKQSSYEASTAAEARTSQINQVLPPEVLHAVTPTSGRSVTKSADTHATESKDQTSPALNEYRVSAPNPTLADLLSYRPSNIRLPKPSDLTSSTDFAIYTRRYDKAVHRIDKAFNRNQILRFARTDLKIPRLANKVGKMLVIKKIMSDIWKLPNPQEKKAQEEKQQQPSVKTDAEEQETINIDQKDLFFLLGRMDGRELMGQLSRKTSVKLSIVGSPPGVLHISGSPEGIARLQEEWAKVQSEIVTDEAESGSKSGLQPDMCKALSFLTETFVTPSYKHPSKVKITYRKVGSSNSAAPLNRVKKILRRLAEHNSLQASVPTSALVSNDDASPYALVPFVPRETPSWIFSALSTYGLSRLQSVEPGYSVQLKPVSKNAEDMRKVLQRNFPPDHDITLQATFGHHLFMRSAIESKSLDTFPFQSLQNTLHNTQTSFVPNAPPGILNLFHSPQSRPSISDLREHLSALSFSSSSFRRLIYEPANLKPTYGFIKLQRTLAVAKELEKEEGPGNAWHGELGEQTLCDLLLPDAQIDVRLSATSAVPLDEKYLEPYLDVNRQMAPDSISLDGVTYYLYEDHLVRATVFKQGLRAPWADLDNFTVTLERRVDRINRGEKTSAVLMTSKQGIEGYERLI